MNNYQQTTEAGRANFATTSSAPKQALVQKLQGAIQNLRRERDQEYREKVEAEERLRLAKEEQDNLAKIVTDLKSKHDNLCKSKSTLEANLGPLAEEVDDLAEKVRRTTTNLVGSYKKRVETK